jgi:uracil-DNA glycosylase
MAANPSFKSNLDKFLVKNQSVNSVDFRENTNKNNQCKVINCKVCNIESFINKNWLDLLKDEIKKEYFLNIKNILHTDLIFYPALDKIFNFTHFSSFENIKVVIIGQDPYHNPGQAMGLSFSVPKNIKAPPSLVNIYKELTIDIPTFVTPSHGDLTSWAKQGVLLLNDTLTVLKNKPASHSEIGWKLFTKKILELINIKLDNVVFMLWGNHARQKRKLIDDSKHLILEAGHPSPFSVKTFQGCKHFSKANEYLKKHSKTEINW